MVDIGEREMDYYCLYVVTGVNKDCDLENYNLVVYVLGYWCL